MASVTQTTSGQNDSSITSTKVHITTSTTTSTLTLTADLVTVSMKPDRADNDDTFMTYALIGVGSVVFLIIISILICYLCCSRRRARRNVRAMQKARSRPVSSFLQNTDFGSGSSSPVREVHSPLYATDPEQYISGTQPETAESHVYENFGRTADIEADMSRAEIDVQTEITTFRKVSKSGSQINRSVRPDSMDSYVDPNEVVERKHSPGSKCTRGKFLKQNRFDQNDPFVDANLHYENSTTLSVGGAFSILGGISNQNGSANQSEKDRGKYNVDNVNLAQIQSVKLKSSEKKKDINFDAFDGNQLNSHQEGQGSSGDEKLMDYENAGMFKKETGHKSAEISKQSAANAGSQLGHVKSLTMLCDDKKNSQQGIRPRDLIFPLSPASTKKLSHIMETDYKKKKKRHRGHRDKERSKTTTAVPYLAAIQPVRKVSDGYMCKPNNDPPPSPCVLKHKYVNVPRKSAPAVAPKPVKRLDDRSTSCPKAVSPGEQDVLEDLYLDMNVPQACSGNFNRSGVSSVDSDLPTYSNSGYSEDMYVQPCPFSDQDRGDAYMNISRSQSVNEGYENPEDIRMLKR